MTASRKERFAWYFYDWANSAFSTTVITVFLGPYLSAITAKAADHSGFVYPLGIPIYSESFFPYMVSLSVFLQLIILPFVGALADHSNKKKLLLGFFAYLGALSTIMMYFVQNDMYITGAILFLIANVGFGASMVVYNSFLNDLAAPDLRDEISSFGWAFGYLGGGILLALNLVLFANADKLFTENATSLAVRICLSSAGLWWALFTVIPMLYLKDKIELKQKIDRVLLKSGYLKFFETLKDLVKNKTAMWFLIAFICYNDGVQAVITLSAQFGNRELGLSNAVLTKAVLMVQFVAFVGALVFNYVSRRLNTKNAILLSLGIWILTIGYTYGFLHDESGFYILAFVVALVMGGTQALSRSLYTRIIPKGKEAEYFSIYELTDKGSSLLGPLVFGIAMQFTNSYRLGILSLVIFFVLGLIILAKIKIKHFNEVE